MNVRERLGRCSTEGCNSPTIFAVKRSLCRPHYEALLRYGNTDLPFPRDFRERMKLYMERQPNGCVHYTSGHWPNGYAQVEYQGKRWLVHRLVWTLTVGPIPEGMVIDHLCRNPSCVNVEHLEVTTQSVNIARGRGPFSIKREATHCKNGHIYDLFNTGLRRGKWRVCRTCASLRKTRR